MRRCNRITHGTAIAVSQTDITVLALLFWEEDAMLGKARLIKKDAAAQSAHQAQEQPVRSEKTDRLQLAQQIARTTKDWLMSQRHQTANARQAFAALFTN